MKCVECVCSFSEVCVFATKQKMSRNLTSAVYITFSVLNDRLFNDVLFVYLSIIQVSWCCGVSDVTLYIKVSFVKIS